MFLQDRLLSEYGIQTCLVVAPLSLAFLLFYRTALIFVLNFDRIFLARSDCSY